MLHTVASLGVRGAQTSSPGIFAAITEHCRFVYVHTLGNPSTSTVTAHRLAAGSPCRVKNVELLGSNETISFRQTANGLELNLPETLPTKWALAFRITLAGK